MNIFKKNEKKHENRLPTPDKVKKGYRYYCSLVAAAKAVMVQQPIRATAATREQ